MSVESLVFVESVPFVSVEYVSLQMLVESVSLVLAETVDLAPVEYYCSPLCL